MTASLMVDTGKVADRRTLRFSAIDDVLAEVDRLVAAERGGTLRCTGNWSAGQNFGHIAAWIEYGYEGFPMKPPPWLVRIMLRYIMKPRCMRSGMRPGMRIPGAKDGTWGTEPMSTDDGAKRLRAALMRLKNREPAKFHSPAFGQVSEDDRATMTLRHAELHLGFLHP